MTSGGRRDSHALQLTAVDIDHMGHVSNAVYLQVAGRS
jgi:acyl-CoA thioesterase FadM